MKNILFCSPRGRVGGISRWTDNIISYAESLDTSPVKLFWYYSDVPGRNINKLSLVRRVYWGIKVYLPFINGLKQKVKECRFDMAHFSTSGSISFIRDYLALKICRKMDIPTTLHFHFGRMPEVLASNSFEKILFKFCIPYISKFIAMDEGTYRALLNYGCKNVYLVPNPLSPEIETKISILHRQERLKNKIVFAGHVFRSKGVFELIEACKNKPEVKLEILGACSSEIRTLIMDLAGPNSPDWLTVRGNCSTEEVLEAMSYCAVFVLPSYTEGFPNVIIEAMACSAPIIATSVGAIPQMLSSYKNQQCGIIVPPQDSISLRKALDYMIDNPEKAKDMGQNACKKVHDLYSMNKVWSQLKNVWLN